MPFFGRVVQSVNTSDPPSQSPKSRSKAKVFAEDIDEWSDDSDCGYLVE